jgi:hypothetical protein
LVSVYTFLGSQHLAKMCQPVHGFGYTNSYTGSLGVGHAA